MFFFLVFLYFFRCTQMEGEAGRWLSYFSINPGNSPVWHFEKHYKNQPSNTNTADNILLYSSLVLINFLSFFFFYTFCTEWRVGLVFPVCLLFYALRPFNICGETITDLYIIHRHPPLEIHFCFLLSHLSPWPSLTLCSSADGVKISLLSLNLALRDTSRI